MKLTFKIGDRVIPTEDRIDEGYFSSGYSYEVLDTNEYDQTLLIEDDDGDQEWWEADQFYGEDILIPSTAKEAGDLVEKVVTFGRKKYTIDNWSRLTSANVTKDTPKVIADIIESYGYCFCVSAGEVVMAVSKVKKVDNRVVLNNEYTALVSKDSITVGCQTIPYARVLEIVAAHKALHGN